MKFIAFMLLAFCCAQSWSKTKTQEKIAGPKKQVVNVAADAKNFIFNKLEFVQRHQSENSDQQLWEFIPKRQTIGAWKNMITIIHDKGGKANAAELDAIAKSTLSDLEKKGAFVYNAFLYQSPTDPKKRYNVMTFVLPSNLTAEVNIKKIFLSRDGSVVGVTYAERLNGKDSKEIGDKVNHFLKASKEVGTLFINQEFPSPWENKK